MKNTKDIIYASKDEIISSLQECIKIKSVTGNKEAVQQALTYYLDLAANMGLSAVNVEGLGGVVQFGDGQLSVGMIVHLDVVPEGTGWQSPPFEARIQDNKIYGRGAIDDKGPAIAALYALKAVKDSGFKPDHKIQIIVGIDEEDIWESTPQLLKRIKEPDFSFVPDSKFPIVIAEKGLIWLELTKELNSSERQCLAHNEDANNPETNINTQSYGINSNSEDKLVEITSLAGGKSLNIVPDYCTATLKMISGETQSIEQALNKFTDEKGYDITIDQQKSKSNSDLTIISKGKPAHAFVCNEGINAVSQMVLFLNQLNIVPEQKAFIQFYADKIGIEFYGESLGLQFEDKMTGKLTINPGFIEMKDNMITLKIDLRFPSSYRLEEIKEKAINVFQGHADNIKVLDSLESLRFPEDDPHIEKLLSIYKDFTGDKEAKPLGMGGTTFAKAFKNAVAFGPTFPGMKKVEHQPDEYMDIDHLLQCTEIYAQAIIALAGDS